MPSNNETILMQNVADLQTQVAFMNKAIREMYALWGPIFQWSLLQAECKFGDNVQEFVLRKLKSLGAIEDQLELANALNAELQAQLAAANARQAEIVAELAQLRAEKAAALERRPVAFMVHLPVDRRGIKNDVVFYRKADVYMLSGHLKCGDKVIPLYAAPVPTPATAPDGWSIRREGEHIVIQKTDIGGVVVKQNPSDAREVPEAILWALANDLLQSAQEPKP